jgi:hypothetical protein
MKFILDENLPEAFADGLSCFGEDVDHVLKHFSRGTTDVKILEFVGSKGYFLITKDRRIRYNQNEILAVRQYDVGAFFLIGKTMKMWDMVKQLVNSWENIKEIADTQQKPFIYKLRVSGYPIRYNL